MVTTCASIQQIQLPIQIPSTITSNTRQRHHIYINEDEVKKDKMSGTRKAEGREILAENPEGKRPVGRTKRRLNNMI